MSTSVHENLAGKHGQNSATLGKSRREFIRPRLRVSVLRSAMNADFSVFGELRLTRKRGVACDAGQQIDKGTGFHNRNGVLLVCQGWKKDYGY